MICWVRYFPVFVSASDTGLSTIYQHSPHGIVNISTSDLQFVYSANKCKVQLQHILENSCVTPDPELADPVENPGSGGGHFSIHKKSRFIQLKDTAFQRQVQVFSRYLSSSHDAVLYEVKRLINGECML